MAGVSRRFVNRRKVWIVLPAYNEEQGLPRLLDRIDEAMEEAGLRFEVLIVDDGSTDGTVGVSELWANKMDLRVRSHASNQGLGQTLRDGVEWACSLASPDDIVITLDADNTHTPELIVRMVRMIREGHDVVIASRFAKGSHVRGVPFKRRFMTMAARIVLKAVFPIRGVSDYTCGYRAYRAGLLQKTTGDDPDFFDQDGFQVMVDILLKLRRIPGLVFGEAPLILRYDLKEGASKMNVAATARNTLSLVLKRRFT